MKILILGATGRIGMEIVQQSLERGHEPTAYVRTAGKFSLRDERLSVAAGDIDNRRQLTQAALGKDAVLSALRQADLKPGTSLLEAAKTICQAMALSKTRRLIAISRALLIPGGGLLDHFFRYLIRSNLGDARQVEAIFRQSDLDWTIARPSRLSDTEKTNYSVFEESVDPAASISRKTLAAFMLDTLEEQKYLRKIVGVTGSN
jgi:putative NADH-flavin reductase